MVMLNWLLWQGRKFPTIIKSLATKPRLNIIRATTASTLTHLFYELVSNPNQLDKLRDELTPYFDSECNGLNIQKLQGLEQLNAVINETLRLYPSLPTRLQRLTPPEGIEIGETYIPGNITVWCPQYAVGRSKCSSLFNPCRGIDS